ncbi:ribose 5-phosphate isomerase A [Paenibacillus sp. HN-1]|uniref:ribose 5-phosphate isomerase A n=1 Tax=Paenibacillus TaxID=44249 RepID=UPI001CA935D4|nr:MULTISPECIES: ribose 5-phosphate isomerase A [Paenibacillus]MBY9077868.1 ribose 5-phosphate isomerase A [Paenibacillus sp. CGMCC 1.18879]MBY9088176.1 ribose 5-phosphate isomerase A [Paenibacillus sinensis]
MKDDELKQACAKAALTFIEDGTIIGLGGGSTVSYLISYIKESGINVKVVTPSFKTRMLCLQNGLTVPHTGSVSKLAVAFDGCDEVDEDFNALKSGGGIHTREKLVARMAERYMLLADAGKVVSRLTFRKPVVLEVLEDALAYTEAEAARLGGRAVLRRSEAKDGYTATEDGNPLLDIFFSDVDNISELQLQLKSIPGVVETSLFTEEVTDVLIAAEDGISWLSKYPITEGELQ